LAFASLSLILANYYLPLNEALNAKGSFVLEQIKQLSEEYREKFPLMAVVIFNASNAHLIEALRKQSYVDALDEITGDGLCVFWAGLPAGRVELPSFPPGTMGMMVPVYKEPNSNKSLYEYFEISNGQSLPILVTFTFTSEDKLLYSKHPISEGTAEDAYNSLKAVLNEKAGLIADFSKELKEDKEKMFKELGVFDSANSQLGIFNKFINMLATVRSASSI
jgi:hypothetical protein